MVIGRLQTQSWEKDGVKRSRTEIVATDVNFLDGPGGGGTGNFTGGAPASPGGSTGGKKSDDVVIQDLDGDQTINLDDIPF
jgi:single-stranded DNA-binding protein